MLKVLGGKKNLQPTRENATDYRLMWWTLLGARDIILCIYLLKLGQNVQPALDALFRWFRKMSSGLLTSEPKMKMYKTHTEKGAEI